MSDDTLRSVRVERTSTGHYAVTNARGGRITLATAAGPDPSTDFTPVELLLAAIGACTAADVDVATSRHAEPTAFTVSVTGHKVSDESGNHLTDLSVTFSVAFPEGEPGDRARTILPRAVATSHNRLCTVSRTVERGTPVGVTVEDA